MLQVLVQVVVQILIVGSQVQIVIVEELCSQVQMAQVLTRVHLVVEAVVVVAVVGVDTIYCERIR